MNLARTSSTAGSISSSGGKWRGKVAAERAESRRSNSQRGPSLQKVLAEGFVAGVEGQGANAGQQGSTSSSTTAKRGRGPPLVIANGTGTATDGAGGANRAVRRQRSGRKNLRPPWQSAVRLQFHLPRSSIPKSRSAHSQLSGGQDRL